MRARIFIAAGLLTTIAACSGPGQDIDIAADAPAATPDLALSQMSGEVPIASDVEVHLPAPPPRETRVPTPAPAAARPLPAPAAAPVTDLVEAPSTEPAAPMAHVHPKAADTEEESVGGPSAEGGGKPRGVTEGLGRVPDRGWVEPGVIDDPNPLPGLPGRSTGVITRGGAGGVDDDCANHRPQSGGVGAMVNDRDPRRGALINERAPRSPGGGSMPRGGGIMRGGLR